jgi:acyl-CoA reductase LuxC
MGIMTKEERIAGFADLAVTIRQMDSLAKQELFGQTANTNPWFTEANIELALAGISRFLTTETLTTWQNRYELSNTSKKVGVIMAGNIPMVGFHDLLCVVLAGHKALIKLSSTDKILIPRLVEMLIKINPEFSEQIEFVDKLSGADAVIATGSDNSARYFEKYFKDIPHVIRKNRTSVAILNGKESTSDLQLLGHDIFSFFGLGCRNVAKVFVLKGYDMTILLDALAGFHDVINHPKYFNNYEYNKAIYLVNKTPHLDTGYALFTENSAVVSPLAVIYYEVYTDEKQLKDLLQTYSDKIQCIVSNVKLEVDTVPPGKSQYPEIDDYADNIDTMKFLGSL